MVPVPNWRISRWVVRVLVPPRATVTWMVWLTAAAAKSPVDDIVSAHAAALAQAFRGSLAPVRQIILSSSSPAEAERRLKLFYADWKPQRVQEILEEALQVCAATGAAKAVDKK